MSSVQRTSNANSNQTYSFTYDALGNTTSLKVGGQTLATYTYQIGTGLLLTQTYANGDNVSFTYDNLGRTKTATYSDGRILTYAYDGEGRLYSATVTGNGASETYLYTYDSIGRLIYSEQKEGYTSVLRTNQTYNTFNQLTNQAWQMGGTAYSETYTYNDSDGSLNTMTTGVGTTLTMGYDGLRRLSTVTGDPFNRSYAYRDISGTATTLQVSQLSYPNLGSGVSFGYTYDSLGNIATYTALDGEVITHSYDNQGQLLKAEGDATYLYVYDTVGNILAANGHTYTYGDANWKDLLTAFDGQSITYDASGNPTSYYNGTRWTMTWANGRSLATASDGTTSLSFTYDTNGLRTSKKVGTVTHKYLYASGKLMRETYGSNTLDFFYDANGIPYALKYNGTVYYYVTNLQGDVMRIVNASGTVMACYDYDPYGKVISATGTLANVNPLRYRGYVYDQETGFYYLNSRYYDPAVGRFINADVLVSAGCLNLICNMFAYCLNNPANYLDANGFDAIWIQEGNSAREFGHSGLMVQDEDGEWFYFFWGPSNENFGPEILFGTTHPTDYPHISVNGEDLTNTKQVIQVLAKSNSPAADRAKLITSTRYFKGDYVKTYEKAKDILKSSVQYKLLTNNCVQNTLTAFAESDWRFLLVAHGLENSIIPNRAAERVALLPTEQGVFPWKLLLLDLLT